MAKEKEVQFDNIAPAPDPEQLPEYGVDELPLAGEAVDPPEEAVPNVTITGAYDILTFRDGILSGVIEGEEPEIPEAPLPMTRVAVTFASPLSINLSLGDYYELTLTGNTAITLTDGLATGRKYQFAIKQDATGARLITSWAATGKTIKWKGGSPPLLSIPANKVDIVTMLFDGTTYFADVVLDF